MKNFRFVECNLDIPRLKAYGVCLTDVKGKKWLCDSDFDGSLSVDYDLVEDFEKGLELVYKTETVYRDIFFEDNDYVKNNYKIVRLIKT